MKRTHRIPLFVLKSDPISDRYQFDVDATTDAAEAKYQAAEAKLARALVRRDQAVKQLDKARDKAHARKRLRLASRAVEDRRDELRALAALMRSSPSSSIHRGRKGTPQPVPVPGELI